MSEHAKQDHPDSLERTFAQDARGWVRVGCAVADLIRNSDIVTVTSSLTDPAGEFGEPKIRTVWGLKGLRSGEHDVLDEYRWPSPDGWPVGPESPADRYRCEHYVPGRSA